MTTTQAREEQLPAAAKTVRLTGRLGPVAIVLMVMAAAAPLSVLGGMVPLGLLIGNGIGLPTLFLLAGLVLIIFAFGFTHMTRFVPRSGAFFHYIAAGLSRPLGLAAAWVSIFAYFGVQIGLLAQIGSVLEETVGRLGGPDINWWVYSFVILAAIGYLGYRNIDLSTKVLGLLLVAEIGIVVVLSVVVLGTGGAEGLTLNTFGWDNVMSGSPAIGLMFCMASFLGFESTAIYRDEARDPERTIPRATFAAVIIVGVFYGFASWMMIMAWGEGSVVAAAAANPVTLIVETASQYLGPTGVVILNVLLLTSVFAAILAFHNVIARYFHALGHGGLLPAGLGRAHPRHGSPYKASLTTTIIAVSVIVVCMLTGVSAMQVLSWSTGDAALGVMALMALTSLSVVVFFRRTRLSTRVWQAMIAPAVAFLALGAIVVLLVLNYPMLVGETDANGAPAFGPLSVTLLALLVPFIVTGLVQAAIVKRRNPEAYARIVDFDA